MISREFCVYSNQVSYWEREASQILGSSNFSWSVLWNSKRKLCSSLCYHTISACTCFCVCICLIFRFAYLAYYCFCAMLFLGEKVYYGICETIFKLRYANHQNSFNDRNCNSNTELCDEFWKIKDNKHSASITWKILGRRQAYNKSSKRCLKCSLCLKWETENNIKMKQCTETMHRNNKMLNKQKEILNKCRHKNKYAVISCDSKD